MRIDPNTMFLGHILMIVQWGMRTDSSWVLLPNVSLCLASPSSDTHCSTLTSNRQTFDTWLNIRGNYTKIDYCFSISDITLSRPLMCRRRLESKIMRVLLHVNQGPYGSWKIFGIEIEMSRPGIS